MTKHHYLLIFVAALIFAWWFRYDVYCSSERNCIAYDRFLGEWIFPREIAVNTSREKIVKNLIVETQSSMDYKRALLYGWSYEEIINELRSKK